MSKIRVRVGDLRQVIREALADASMQPVTKREVIHFCRKNDASICHAVAAVRMSDRYGNSAATMLQDALTQEFGDREFDMQALDALYSMFPHEMAYIEQNAE